MKIRDREIHIHISDNKGHDETLDLMIPVIPTDQKIIELVSEAVRQTCEVMTKTPTFHPVLGLKGEEDVQT